MAWRHFRNIEGQREKRKYHSNLKGYFLRLHGSIDSYVNSQFSGHSFQGERMTTADSVVAI